MDIIHLLEVLKPVGNVVTVKVDNDLTAWEQVKNTVIALAPTIISFCALFYGYKQFKININSQDEQFSKNFQQQLNALKLNARIATEVELEKQACKDIRGLFGEFSLLISEMAQYRLEYKFLCDLSDAESVTRRDFIHGELISKNQKCMNKNILLKSYLDFEDQQDAEFIERLDHVSSMSYEVEHEANELGLALGICSAYCFKLINIRQQKIKNLVDSIAS